MPTVSTVLSGVVSFGVLAGVLTGVCYLLVSGLRWAGLLRAVLVPPPRSSGPAAPDTCARCGRRLWALPGPCRRLRCAHCHLPVCRHCCARASNTRWLCNSCRKLRDVHLQSGEWFYQQLRQRFRSTVAALDNTDKNDGEVQEFMEKLVETIIGGGLDDVTLCPLSDRPEYTNFCALYKDPLVHILRRLYANLRMALSDSASQDGEASDLHSELKDLLKQIIHDAMSQPQFKEGNGTASWMCQEGEAPASLDQKSYEDILATAILNKIFAKYQQNRFRRKRKSRSNEKSFDKNSNLLSSEKSPEAMQDELPRSESDSDSVANSLDDGSWSESSHIEPLSVTIEECIEEVTTRYSSDDEAEPKSDMDRFLSNLKYIRRQRAPFPELGKDIVDGDISSSDGDGGDDAGGEVDKDDLSAGVELLNPVDSWEENWLFQRRRLKTGMGTCQPVPVPMLVPNPTEDCRAMIGDVDADEMSDLSDCSDSVLEDLLDGPDDRKYFESQQEESDEEKPIEVIDKQREIFLQYITEDLNKLIEPRSEDRGLSPDTGQSETVSSDIAQEAQVTTVAEELTVKDQSTGSPEETDSSHSYSVAETRNLNVPIVQIDSGEGSLDMQQDSEYTVAYATVAQVRPSSQEPSPAPSSAPSPIPKPRTVRPPLEPHEEPTDEKSDEERNSLAELSLPPKPGTIAEREHLKWEKAPPLANNPYSKENIARRQRQRMYLSRHSSSENSIEFPELTPTKEPSLMEIDSKHRRDDFNKYVRDYYVNVAEDKAVEVSSVGFEEAVLKGGLSQVKLRAIGASPQFKVNPLYEEAKGCAEDHHTRPARSSRSESGYASSLESLTSWAPGERLAPPATPEVVERTFLTLTTLRSQDTGSLRSRARSRKERCKFGGSLRLNKSAFYW